MAPLKLEIVGMDALGEADRAEWRAMLADNPALVNTDPWGDGWMVRIKLSDVTEVDELMTAEEYDEYIEKEAGH